MISKVFKMWNKKECVEDYRKIRVFDVIQSNKKLNESDQEIKYRDIDEGHIDSTFFDKNRNSRGFRLDIITTPCNFGSVRSWFLCPRCNNRVATLFYNKHTDDAYCRNCLNLTYKARQEKIWILSNSFRIYKKIDKIDEKLKNRCIHAKTVIKLLLEKEGLIKIWKSYIKTDEYILENRLNKSHERALKCQERVANL